MKKFFVPVFACALIALPIVASADTLSDLQTKLQSLLSQVASVQAQITSLQAQTSSASTVAHSDCLSLSNTLSLGTTDTRTDGEVSKLQRFLAQSPSLYPEGLVTGYFGSATARAVGRLQEKAGIASSTSAASGAGTVGLATRLFLAKTCGTSGTAPASPWQAPSLSTALPSISIDTPSLISLSATPTITGKATNVSALTAVIDSGNSTMYKNESIHVTGGSWSITSSALPDGAYKVVVRSIDGSAVASGYLIVSASANATTTPAIPVSIKAPAPIVVLPTFSTEKPEVSVSANGSTHGAATLAGASAFIGWNAKNSSTCTISSDRPTDLSGSVPTFSSGSPTGPLSQTTTFTVACTGNDANPVSGSVTVTVGR